VRKQVRYLAAQLRDSALVSESGAKRIAGLAETLERRSIRVEAVLFGVNLTGAREDASRKPMQLSGRLGALQSDLAGMCADLPPERRANDLVSRMTLAEEVSQMQDVAPAIERLGIPAYNWWNEALHGVARSGLATSFPQAIGLAATWDDSLIFRMATVISDEARAKHHEYLRQGSRERYQGLTFWSPNINLFRDPRWGRGQETYGEDPFL